MLWCRHSEAHRWHTGYMYGFRPKNRYAIRQQAWARWCRHYKVVRDYLESRESD
jgi:hypothetical protein